MQRDLIVKYLLDIESVIGELKELCERYPDFDSFNNDFMAKRTAERLLEIIGEAVNKLRKIDNDIQISGTKHIVGLRNLIIHSYDTVDPGILWGIIQKDIPILEEDIQRLRQ